MKCYKTEGLTSIKLKIHCDDLDYLTGADIETCIEIAKSHQKTCFSVWHIETTSTIVEAKHGNMVTILTPMLIINIYQKHEEETE